MNSTSPLTVNCTVYYTGPIAPVLKSQDRTNDSEKLIFNVSSVMKHEMSPIVAYTFITENAVTFADVKNRCISVCVTSDHDDNGNGNDYDENYDNCDKFLTKVTEDGRI